MYSFSLRGIGLMQMVEDILQADQSEFGGPKKMMYYNLHGWTQPSVL